MIKSSDFSHPKPLLFPTVVALLLLFLEVQAKCRTGCDLALASYYVWEGSNLTYISGVFRRTIPEILRFNPNLTNPDYVPAGIRVNVPFTCDCLNGDFLGHTFRYVIRFGDTYDKVAKQAFANLTTADWVQRVNVFDPTRIPDGTSINVTVNCSCGDRRVSRDYGLFATYPIRPGENVSSVAAGSGVAAEVVERFNLGADFTAGNGLVYVPAKDQQGNYPPLKIRTSARFSGKAIAGISVAGAATAIFMVVCLRAGVYRRKKTAEPSFLPEDNRHYIQHRSSCGRICVEKAVESTAPIPPLRFSGITVDKSVEFTYEELSNATDDFSEAHKIGEGGFGSVYYAELRGERAAIKKMDMQASQEFLAELKVLTHVHHLNLVRLIGYCVESSLFLVYEYIENGNLSEHLRGKVSGKDSLSWSTRVQIALDSARGLEYIHEHTVPVYIHRDIKSANILIDQNFHAKVADFGLTRLTEYGNSSLHTRLVGTFGYMSPEYAQYGDVSPKIDVYAFGVVLYELISGKQAVVKTDEAVSESQGLVALFEEVLNRPDPQEHLHKLIDPRLGTDYPLDSIRKMANLGKACTQENPHLRPSMRAIVVGLMTLSSSTEDWDVGSYYENEALVNLMLGR